MRRRSLCERQAFTLVEIMIVCAIIGLLAALAIPSFIKNPKSGSINTTDLLGNLYLIGIVGDTQMAVSATTKSALNGVGIDWGAY